MNQSKIVQICVIVAALVIVIVSLYQLILDGSRGSGTLILLAACFLLLLGCFDYFLKSVVPLNIRVAFIGFPGSGKTTLITSIFREGYNGKLRNVAFDAAGPSTISRIEENSDLLDRGHALPSTEDQNAFSYEATITIGKLLSRKTLKVAFGDFPGEDVEKFSDSADWLKDTNYFKNWVLTADSLVFVVDLKKYFSAPQKRDEYVRMITLRFQTAWSHFSDHRGRGSKRAKNINVPVTLVFSKFDLIEAAHLHMDKHSWNSELEEQVREGISQREGSSAYLLPISPEASTEEKYKMIVDGFEDLINFFKRKTNQFNYVCVSSFGTIEKKRCGIDTLVKSIIPR